MKKVLLVLALVGLIAAPAMADMIQTTSPILGHAAGTVSGSPRGTVYYSNITNGPTAAFSQPAGVEIGDDLLMTNLSPIFLDSVDFSVYNSSSSAGPLTAADLTLKFYNHDALFQTYTLAGTITYTGVTFQGMSPGYFTTFSVTGLYDPLNPITLGNDIIASLTISNLVGGANKVGQVLMNPPTVGSSQNAFWLNGQFGWWFGGTPVANFYWQIDGIPEPATLALLAVGALALIRRR